MDQITTTIILIFGLFCFIGVPIITFCCNCCKLKKTYSKIENI